MVKINLPKAFENKLSQSQELTGTVLSTIATFGDILIVNNLYFFEEYTDHGVKHVEDVLASTAKIIKDETLNNTLSARDIAFYVLSVVLHDIAMHLSIDGFNQLLAGEFDDIRLKEFDKYTWKQLWNEYLNEAKKFNGKQLKAIFGDQNIIIRKPSLTNAGEINGNDKKLIGEFIRRHHTRLAHEIALKGFPGANDPIPFANGLDERDRQLIGLIARSHGLDLRTCVDYIENTYGKNNRSYIHNIHIVFLFVLLRISDYLQIDSSRTSRTRLKIRTFSSPFSAIEHKAHLSVDSIDYEYQHDPERIFVHASPENSSMYLKLQKLIQDIQHEFDISWAVLGEIYGNISKKPEIKFRRITSNLQEEKFNQKQTYVADQFYFKANDEIVKLLIAPLYGNNTKYGVRELIQNAVDACKEREVIERNNRAVYDGIIEVRIFEDKDNNNYFEIRDNGIGMTGEIIKEYFLTAGASYRRSFDWQKNFTDIEGNSNVDRSGQFGVGVLAAFLIGKSIYVETKHINSEIGYKFHADLDSEQIEISKNTNLKNGTFIRIKIEKDRLPFFRADRPGYRQNFEVESYEWANWYMLPKPIIKYAYFQKKIIPPVKLGPDLHSPGEEWRCLEVKGYNKILWTYNTSYGKSFRDFICNGIVIPNAFSSGYLRLSPFNNPKISVFDNNAILPLTLDRDGISNPVSFIKDLKADICKDFLAYVLLFNPSCHINNSVISPGLQYLNYPGMDDIQGEYLASKKGFLIPSYYTLKKIGNPRIIELKMTQGVNSRPIKLDVEDAFLRFEGVNDFSNDSYKSEFSRSAYHFGEEGYERKRLNDVWLYIKKEKYDYLFDDSKQRMSVRIKRIHQFEYERSGIACIKIGTTGDSLITASFLEEYAREIVIINEGRLQHRVGEDSIIDKLLERYLGDNVVIPYSLEERKKLYPLAFEELEYYMQKHEANSKKHANAQQDSINV